MVSYFILCLPLTVALLEITQHDTVSIFGQLVIGKTTANSFFSYLCLCVSSGFPLKIDGTEGEDFQKERDE